MTHLWNWATLVMQQKLELVLFFFTIILIVMRDQLPMSQRHSLTHSRGTVRYHKEALAVVFSLKKLHQFLQGKQFILVTDHY